VEEVLKPISFLMLLFGLDKIRSIRFVIITFFYDYHFVIVIPNNSIRKDIGFSTVLSLGLTACGDSSYNPNGSNQTKVVGIKLTVYDEDNDGAASVFGSKYIAVSFQPSAT